MKTNAIISLVAFFLLACVSTQPMTRLKPDENLIRSQEGDEEYELIIIDNRFDSWFLTNSRPVNFYSESYYETKNQLYVTAWNDLFFRYNGRAPFENQINYDHTIDYGLELNYKLFWYFKYIEDVYGSYYNFPA